MLVRRGVGSVRRRGVGYTASGCTGSIWSQVNPFCWFASNQQYTGQTPIVLPSSSSQVPTPSVPAVNPVTGAPLNPSQTPEQVAQDVSNQQMLAIQQQLAFLNPPTQPTACDPSDVWCNYKWWIIAGAVAFIFTAVAAKGRR